MNARLLLLGLSLAANVALGAWLALRPAPIDPKAAAGAHATAPAGRESDDPRQRPLDAHTWSTLAAGDDADYARQLRAEGLPPAVIRALVTARIRARYAAQLEALRPKGRDEFWRRNDFNPDANLTAEARAERRKINREINDQLRAVLGADADAATAGERAARLRQFGDLPAPKLEAVQALLTDYSELAAQVRDRSQGITLPEDREQLRLIERESRADLAALLSPGELREYDLRSSSAAQAMRGRLTLFEPSEEEYRALVGLRLDFDRTHGGAYLSEEEQARKRAAEPAFIEQARAVLSPERFAEFQLTTNDDFRNTVYAVGRFNYDQAVAREVFQLRQDIAARAATVQQNPLFTADQRAAELAALQREATAKLTTRLGPKAYEAFVRESAGSWVRKLQPTATSPGGAGP